MSQTVIPEEDQPEMIEKIAKGNFTMRIMYEQFQNLTKMGPMSQVRCPASHSALTLTLNLTGTYLQFRSALASAPLILSPACIQICHLRVSLPVGKAVLLPAGLARSEPWR